MKKALLTLLLAGSLSEAKALDKSFFQIGLGLGQTSTAWENDLPQHTQVRYIEIGGGFNINKYFNLNINGNISEYSKKLSGFTFDITPRLELNSEHAYAGIGIGMAHNTIQAKGYTAPWKWTPQAYAGLKFTIGQDEQLLLGYKFYHLSHSLIDRWDCTGCNVGLNTDNLEFKVRRYIK